MTTNGKGGGADAPQQPAAHPERGQFVELPMAERCSALHDVLEIYPPEHMVTALADLMLRADCTGLHDNSREALLELVNGLAVAVDHTAIEEEDLGSLQEALAGMMPRGAATESPEKA